MNLDPFVEVLAQKDFGHSAKPPRCARCGVERTPLIRFTIGTTSAGPPNCFEYQLCTPCREDVARLLATAIRTGQPLEP